VIQVDSNTIKRLQGCAIPSINGKLVQTLNYFLLTYLIPIPGLIPGLAFTNPEIPGLANGPGIASPSYMSLMVIIGPNLLLRRNYGKSQ
jgi:hypothetical protein